MSERLMEKIKMIHPQWIKIEWNGTPINLTNKGQSDWAMIEPAQGRIEEDTFSGEGEKGTA
jgi:hypothetical protein